VIYAFNVLRERRAADRMRLVFPVLLEGPFGIRRCVARDVSARGLFVETADPYRPGMDVAVTFTLPDGSWEMTVRCIVRRILKLEASDGTLLGVGLSFEESEDLPAPPFSPARRMRA